MTLNGWYWFGGGLGFMYGCIHLFYPDQIALSWGRDPWSDDSKDFARLLGCWILFQSFVAWIIASKVEDKGSRYWFTVVHVFKNLLAFLLRCSMWKSGRYLITTGFKASTYGDLLFVLGYGYYVLFPESKKTK